MLIVPTDVREEDTTVPGRLVPERDAVTVQEPPSAQGWPLTVVEELARYAFAMGVPCHTPDVIVPTLVREELVIALGREEPEKDAETVQGDPSVQGVPLMVIEELARYVFWIGDPDQLPFTMSPTIPISKTIVPFCQNSMRS